MARLSLCFLVGLLAIMAPTKPVKGDIPFLEEPLLYDTFPDNFVWACATSAYQIEGGWNADGKGESIWDRFAHDPSNIEDGSNGDVACDTYNKWPEDIELLKTIGVNHYRFSIAWTRILPNGIGTINPAGIQWYSDFVDALLEAGITPMVTLYHWDMPQALEDQGGMLNPEFASWFLEYADIVFSALQDRVKFWITFNEPWVMSIEGYTTGVKAPGLSSNPGEFPYQASHNMIRAHGKTYRLYKEKYGDDGQVGITLNIGHAYPNTDTAEDIAAAQRGQEFSLGWYAHPIYLTGDYPQSMRDRIDAKSAAQGFPQSRLPSFTDEEKAEIQGSWDFLGINFYTATIVYEDLIPPNDCISYFCDSDTGGYQGGQWYPSGSSWLKVIPPSIRELLKYIRDTYGNPPLYITENGVSDRAGNVDDLQRVYYYRHTINQVLKAIKIDGCDVRGYTAWSLMDNYEWNFGYLEKFGVTAVDFEDEARPRTLKRSAKYYSKIIAQNGFQQDPAQCVLGD